MPSQKILYAIFLGLLQGVTEFLPVSSSGHLVLFQRLFGLKEPELFFDVLLHLATMAATVFFFRNDLSGIIRSAARREKSGLTYLSYILVATIPTLLIGFATARNYESVFASLNVVRAGFFATALILIVPSFLPHNPEGEVTGLRALLIGTMQGLSVIPGLSRSGSTIMTGIIMGVNQQSSFTFSFILSIPAIASAVGLHVAQGRFSTTFPVPAMVLGFAAAFFSGYLSLAILRKVVLRMKMHYFGYYLLALILVTIASSG